MAAQCLIAAAATVEEGRLPHSLHGYFLRAGRSDLPVILEVDRDRDGRSFSARHVVAVQDGEVIFSMLTSFQTETDGRRLRRRAAPRGARARGHAAGRLEPAARGARGHADRLLEGCLHRLRVGALADPAARRPAGAPGRPHLPLRRRHRVRSAGRGVGRAGAARRSTTPCGSRRTSEPTTGCSSTCGRSRRGSARGCYDGSLRDRDGSARRHAVSGAPAVARIDGRPGRGGHAAEAEAAAARGASRASGKRCSAPGASTRLAR